MVGARQRLYDMKAKTGQALRQCLHDILQVLYPLAPIIPRRIHSHRYDKIQVLAQPVEIGVNFCQAGSAFEYECRASPRKILKQDRTIVILLDEPVEGLAPLVVKDFAERLLKLKEIGVTILFSEQNVRFSLSIADRAFVIDRGRIRYQGSIAELSANEEVKRDYLMI